MKRAVLLFLTLGFLSCMAFQPTLAANGNPAEQATSIVKLGQNYPNPATGKTIIEFSFNSPEATLTVYNVLGKVVEEFTVVDKRIVIDVTNYPEGVYLYTLEADGEKITRRMTVRK